MERWGELIAVISATMPKWLTSWNLLSSFASNILQEQNILVPPQ